MNFLSSVFNKILTQLDKKRVNKFKTEQPLKPNLNSKTLVFAHRGSKSNNPENTLAAFREAIRVQSDGIELDVHLSLDNELIVIHDEKIDRTTNGKGLVRKMTSADIQKFDAGSWYHPNFADEKIPRLSEVLKLLTDLSFNGYLNIEIKTDKFNYPGIEKKISELMTESKWPFIYIYSSFNLQSLKRIHELEPKIEINYLTKNILHLKKRQEGILTYFITGIHPRRNYALKHPLLLKASNRPFRLWTVNQESEMRKAFQQNVAGIITDYPEQALKIRQQIQEQPK
ncbi:glycerophosphodiester phosphodiesterase [Lactococcus cremoris]|uniref:Glycerophosphoryl diester phosphodiesterase n=1 Tax=Lactococcus cremoris subsp. tructae TaxID=542833 RepID=A0A2A5SQ92_LACLC|nr:glycerophosphodiester phosphodiesterase [Lactococcus cremoris]PCS16388.1 glycerophosphoryl diester phosphodiesterase [Lactococcus cremoris subsp. tructae]